MVKRMGMCNSIIKQLRIITLFAIIMLFSSCELFQIPIIGTFIYKDISTIQRKSASATPIWESEAQSNQHISYSISPSTEGISINSKSGIITVSDSAQIMDANFIIRAEAINNYKGGRNASIRVVVAKEYTLTGSFSYDNIIITDTSTPVTISPRWQGRFDENQEVQYAINTELPTGLALDTATGEISGTPTVLQASSIYTIRAEARPPYTNPEPKITATISIGITAPITGSFSYNNITAIKDTEITETSPQWSDDAPSDITATYTIDPTFADTLGLTFNTADGTISGTPTVLQTSASYTITATAIAPYTDPDPKITATVQIEITTPITGTFIYTNITATKDNRLTEDEHLPKWTDAAEGQLDENNIAYSIAPTDTTPATDSFDFNAATGLVFNTSTGEISGTPTVPQTSASYTITATAIAPYTDPAQPITATVQIAITTPLTGTFNYTNISATKDTTIAEEANLPQWTVKGQTVSYSVTNLPAGLSIDATTGAISGTPTVPQTSASYTITATGTSPYTSSKTATVQITITTPITGTFSYTTQTITATEGAAITAVLPTTWSGVSDSAQTIEYVIRPGLPEGLLFNTSSGEISGEPTEPIASSREYSVEARGISPYTGTISASNTITIELTPLVKYSSIASGTNGTSSPEPAKGSMPNGLSYTIATTSAPNFTPTIAPTLPTIDNQGIITVDKDTTTAGTYVVNISGSGYSGKDKVYFYVTTSPTASDGINGAQDAIKAGIEHFGNTADFNYIQLNGTKSLTAAFQNNTNFNGDISLWDTSNVTSMLRTFNGATAFNGDISKWDTSKVQNMFQMFDGATAFNGDISAWNVSSVTSMGYMFRGATAFNGDISAWNVSLVETMGNMFTGATNFNGDISTWNVSLVYNMFQMFDGATAFNGDISAWDVSLVETMYYMFNGATAFNGDISAWNVSLVDDMRSMFNGATAFTQNLDAWAPRLHASLRKNNMFDSSGLANNPPCWYSSTDANEC